MNIFMKYGILASSGGELVPQWTKKTEMNVLPNLDGWSLTQSGGSATISNSILNITTSNLEVLHYIIETNNIDATKIKRLDSRLRVNTNIGNTNRPGHLIQINDGTKFFSVFLETDKLSYGDNGSTPTTLYTGDMTVYNKIRLEMDNVNGGKLYVNDNLEATVAYSSLFNTGANRILFGDLAAGTTEFGGNVDYDYIYYQLDLAANPDQ